ncbi:MAG: glycosyltransferase family 4 protein [Armatimonadetes bacterium]|nr:glycosyltransferase family 4 protein [Armatimonadota bacterium]
MAQRYRTCGTPIAVVGNYPDLSQFPQPTVSRSERPLLVSIGAQYGPKGAYQIADAYQLIRKTIDCDLAFWGTFHPPELKGELKQRICSQESNQHAVDIEGPIPWTRLMADLLPRAWLGFVLFDTTNPNYRLGLPNRLFEMWAAGVPTVVTDQTEVARLVRQHDAGIVVPDNDPKTLAANVIPLLNDYPRLISLGVNAQRAVRRIYNWTPAFENLLSLYRTLAISPCNREPQHSHNEMNHHAQQNHAGYSDTALR